MFSREPIVPTKLWGLRAIAPDLEAKISDHELLANSKSLDPDQLRHPAALIGCAREPHAKLACGVVAKV